MEGRFLSTFSEPTDLGFSAPRDEESAPLYLGLPAATWGKIAVITGLFAAVFWPNLRRLWQKTNPINGEPNWGHSIVVPIIGLYYLYVHREELLKASGQHFIWGPFARRGRLWVGLGMIGLAALTIGAAKLVTDPNLGTIQGMVIIGARALGVLGLLVLLLDWSLGISLFGLLVYVYGIYPGQNDYVKDLGMVITLFGIVLLMCGWDVMRLAWFPIVFLICALPWPGLVYSWVAGPLQQLAANVAVEVLKITGVQAVCSGTKIIMEPKATGQLPRVLNVAEACAGMRSLMTFIAVGAAVAFLSARPLWEKLVITASSVPIAIFCNVMRVSGQGLLDHYVNEKLSESFAHQFVGMIMLVPAFFLILGVGAALDKMFLDEVDETDRSFPPMAPPLAMATTALPVSAPVMVARTPVPKIAPPAAAPHAVPPRIKPITHGAAAPAVTPPRPPGLTAATRPPSRVPAATPAPSKSSASPSVGRAVSRAVSDQASANAPVKNLRPKEGM